MKVCFSGDGWVTWHPKWPLFCGQPLKTKHRTEDGDRFAGHCDTVKSYRGECWSSSSSQSHGFSFHTGKSHRWAHLRLDIP